jgi:hypothetical protein
MFLGRLGLISRHWDFSHSSVGMVGVFFRLWTGVSVGLTVEMPVGINVGVFMGLLIGVEIDTHGEGVVSVANGVADADGVGVGWREVQAQSK